MTLFKRKERERETWRAARIGQVGVSCSSRRPIVRQPTCTAMGPGHPSRLYRIDEHFVDSCLPAPYQETPPCLGPFPPSCLHHNPSQIRRSLRSELKCCPNSGLANHLSFRLFSPPLLLRKAKSSGIINIIRARWWTLMIHLHIVFCWAPLRLCRSILHSIARVSKKGAKRRKKTCCLIKLTPLGWLTKTDTHHPSTCWWLGFNSFIISFFLLFLLTFIIIFGRVLYGDVSAAFWFVWKCGPLDSWWFLKLLTRRKVGDRANLPSCHSNGGAK